jgi:hypothetical protein
MHGTINERLFIHIFGRRGANGTVFAFVSRKQGLFAVKPESGVAFNEHRHADSPNPLLSLVKEIRFACRMPLFRQAGFMMTAVPGPAGK